MRRHRLVLPLMLFLILPVLAAGAQTGGVLQGAVRDSAGAPIADARIEVRDAAGAVAAAVRTDARGIWAARLPAGGYRVLATRLGFAPSGAVTAEVAEGGTSTVDLTLREAPGLLTGITTTASRVAERAVDAPASVAVVPRREIEERPAMTTTDHLRSVPGVDISQGGLIQSNVTARGFNNIFSGALLTLQDHRIASVPSLRVNVPYLFTSSLEDVERIEVVLGPGAALYGPNTSNGVLHVITRSPLDAPGSSATFDAGERGTMRAAGRTAVAVTPALGVKVSADYLRGRDWQYRDPAEPATVPRPSGPGTRVSSGNARDFDVARSAGEARIDLRPGAATELVGSYGYAQAIGAIELTAANGAAQVRHWTYQHAQLRGTHRGFFGQLFLNTSDAGNEDSVDTRGTYLLRTGQPIVDQSRVIGAQAQQRIALGGARVVAGADWLRTDPRTGGTINGRNEEDDEVGEYGGYAHAQWPLAADWELVGALRLDRHSELAGTFVSPRAAIVWKPGARHQLRATYNRAFQTPGNFQFFLDLQQARLTPLPYAIRAVGNPEGGYRFARDCAGGEGQLCMRVPAAFGGATAGAIPAAAATRFQDAVTIASPSLPAPLVAALRQMNPTPAQVGTDLRFFDPALVATGNPFGAPVDPSVVRDIDGLDASRTTVYEIGYKGFVLDRLSLAADAWYERRRNFIAAAANVTPNVFLDRAELQAYLTAAFTPSMGAAAAAATAAQVAPGLARIPLGTVVPDHPAADDNELLFTYQNVRRSLDLQGLDLAAELLVTPRVSVQGTYSWMSDVEFADIPNGTRALALNAPPSKGSVALRWRDERGLSAEARWRYVNEFPVNSGVYVGRAPVNERLDAFVSWRWRAARPGVLTTLSGTNLLDRRVPSFVGTAPIGRLVMARVHLTM